MSIKETFNRQESDSVRKAFEESTDHRSFFVLHDALHNVEHEIVYSVRGRYTCHHNCQVCNFRHEFPTEEAMAPFTGHYITDEYEAMASDTFKYFSEASCVDDLYTLKTQHPGLFHFYEAQAPQMEYHTTDNGFIKEYPLLMNELRFGHIGQISFSDVFLGRKKGKLLYDLQDMLRKLNIRSPIRRINFIITEKSPTDNPLVMEMVEFTTDQLSHAMVLFHNDIRDEVDFLQDVRADGYFQPSCYEICHNVNPPLKCNLYSETVHLRYDGFYPDLHTSMELNNHPYYEMSTQFEPDKFLVGLLNEKKAMYGLNARTMTSGSKLHEYFRTVSEQLIVEPNFTFIPAPMLDPSSRFYQRMVFGGEWQNTFAGMIRKNATAVIPIVRWQK